ncbi:sigma-70 family RNA polymerase sigma factor [Streptomyces alboflavus]|uniref:sigma-70 family RNA polymerase sigma factor n=1 Tax=Streptomyces alboflavus TaxID=67267 RepID=UPI000B003AC6
MTAAQSGDAQARERLVAEHLPLIYNVVGRALGGHADVDDVTQEAMFRALDGLDGLRDPARFRSWLVAIAMNLVRRRWQDQQQRAAASLDRVAHTPDPLSDFVDLTILRLGLSGQRREVAEATRWLDEDDRDLLALWWQEAAGELTRAELAAVLAITPRHAAVRIKRMKDQLEVSRVVVRALTAEPRCTALSSLLTEWDGHPRPVWRKRIARHVRTCPSCSGHWSNLVPAEGLLVGLSLVVPLHGFGIPSWLSDTTATAANATAATPRGETGHFAATGDSSGPAGATGPGGSDGSAVTVPHPATGPAPTAAGPWRVPLTVGGGVAAGGVLLALLWPFGRHDAPEAPAAAPPPTTRPVTSPTFSTPPPTSRPPTSRPPKTTSPPTPQRTVKPSSTKPSPPAPKPLTREQRLTKLVNSRRAQAGCAPLRTDPRLSAAARDHAKDMVERGYYDHDSPEGTQPNERMSKAGYPTWAWAENLDRGTSDPAVIVDHWMDGSIHQENMLNCEYRDTGVAAVSGPNGLVWVQNLANSS